MRIVLAFAILMTLAGCTENVPDEIGDEPGGGRVSEPGSQSARDNATRVLDHTIVWVPDAAPAPTTMLVPGNATSLRVEVANVPRGPCGSNVGEQDDPTFPHAAFTDPSGAVARISLFAQECDTGIVFVSTFVSAQDLPLEAGLWQVSFHGRGIDLEQHLVVLAHRA